MPICTANRSTTVARFAGALVLATLLGACAGKIDINSSVVIPANDAARLQVDAPRGGELTLRNESAHPLPIEFAVRQDQAAGLFIGNAADRLESRITRRWRVEGSRTLFIRNNGGQPVEVAYRFRGKSPLDVRVSPRPVTIEDVPLAPADAQEAPALPDSAAPAEPTPSVPPTPPSTPSGE